MICVSLWVSDVSDVSWSPGGQVGLTPRHQLLSGGCIWEGRWSLVIACRSQIGSAYCHTGNAGPLSVMIQNSKHQASKHQAMKLETFLQLVWISGNGTIVAYSKLQHCNTSNRWLHGSGSASSTTNKQLSGTALWKRYMLPGLLREWKVARSGYHISGIQTANCKEILRPRSSCVATWHAELCVWKQGQCVFHVSFRKHNVNQFAKQVSSTRYRIHAKSKRHLLSQF